jgi:hypothetical protein
MTVSVTLGTETGAGVQISGATLRVDRVARKVRADGNDRASSSILGRVNDVPHLPHFLGKAALLFVVPVPDPDPPDELVLFFPFLRLLGLGPVGVSSRDLTGCLNSPHVLHHAVWSSVPGLTKKASRIRARWREERDGEMD